MLTLVESTYALTVPARSFERWSVGVSNDQPKQWWKSKTIVLNGLTAGIAVLTALQGQAIVQEYPRASAAVVAGLSALNIALRIVTYLPIGG